MSSMRLHSKHCVKQFVTTSKSVTSGEKHLRAEEGILLQEETVTGGYQEEAALSK